MKCNTRLETPIFSSEQSQYILVSKGDARKRKLEDEETGVTESDEEAETPKKGRGRPPKQPRVSMVNEIVLHSAPSRSAATASRSWTPGHIFFITIIVFKKSDRSIQYEYVIDASEKSINEEQTVNVNDASSNNEDTIQEKTIKVVAF